MSYTLRLHKRVLDFLKTLDPKTRKRIIQKLKELEQSSFKDVKKLEGYENMYRQSIGKWRVVFSIEGNQIHVKLIDDRKSIYEKLKRL